MILTSYLIKTFLTIRTKHALLFGQNMPYNSNKICLLFEQNMCLTVRPKHKLQFEKSCLTIQTKHMPNCSNKTYVTIRTKYALLFKPCLTVRTKHTLQFEQNITYYSNKIPASFPAKFLIAEKRRFADTMFVIKRCPMTVPEKKRYLDKQSCHLTCPNSKIRRH
jgi:hypothetical protein